MNEEDVVSVRNGGFVEHIAKLRKPYRLDGSILSEMISYSRWNIFCGADYN